MRTPSTPCRKLYRRRDDVLVTAAVASGARNELSEVIGVEELAPRRFRRGRCEVRGCEQLFHERQVWPAGLCELSINVLRKIRPQRTRHAVDHRDPWTR